MGRDGANRLGLAVFSDPAGRNVTEVRWNASVNPLSDLLLANAYLTGVLTMPMENLSACWGHRNHGVIYTL